MAISFCFCSSLEKIVIRAGGSAKTNKCSVKARPKEPVPPVINKCWPVKDVISVVSRSDQRFHSRAEARIEDVESSITEPYIRNGRGADGEPGLKKPNFRPGSLDIGFHKVIHHHAYILLLGHQMVFRNTTRDQERKAGTKIFTHLDVGDEFFGGPGGTAITAKSAAK